MRIAKIWPALAAALSGIVIQGLAVPAASASEHDVLARQIDVVRAAGVLRYFHPHEGVTRVDWNRVLHEGFELAADATDDAEFVRDLVGLLAPIGRGIRRVKSAEPVYRSIECRGDEPPVRWAHEGVTAAPAVPMAAAYTSRRTGLSSDGTQDPHDSAVLAKLMRAEPWRGKSLVWSGRIRMPAEGEGVFWIRVVDADNNPLYFDNMDDRRVSSKDWTEKGLIVPVPDDAAFIAYGMVVYGTVPAAFDRVKLQVYDEEAEQAVGESLLEEPGQWRFTSESQRHQHWTMATEEGVIATVTVPPVAEPLAGSKRAALDDFPTAWSLELVDGSFLRVPMAQCANRVQLDRRERERLWRRYPELKVDRLSAADQARLDVAATWAVIQHFYPYRPQLDDWSMALTTALRESRSIETREDHLRLLQRFLHHIDDGHVSVYETDPAAEQSMAFLPVAIESVDRELIIARSDSPEVVRPGDRIVAVDGDPVLPWLERALAHESGSLQWRTHRAIEDLLAGPPDGERMLTLERGGERLSVSLPFTSPRPMRAMDYPVLRELDDGIVHVFLPAVRQEGVDALIPRLNDADGVVLDLRGYPNPGLVPAEFLGHFLDAPDDWTSWMNVMLARGPDGDLVVSVEDQFNLPTAEPRIATPVVFITDHRALSYAESLVGIIKYHELGPIVGSNTAGANGDVIPLLLPGGFTASFTGMRVIGPDGTPHHARGIAPDVEAYPTRAGLRDGHDAVLERAIEILDELLD